MLPLYTSFFSFGFFSAFWIAFFIFCEHAAHKAMFVWFRMCGPHTSVLWVEVPQELGGQIKSPGRVNARLQFQHYTRRIYQTLVLYEAARTVHIPYPHSVPELRSGSSSHWLHPASPPTPPAVRAT